MSKNCTVCAHSSREDIDAAILSGRSVRDIAGRFQLSKSAVDRHASSHIAARLARSAEAAEVVSAERLVGEIRSLGETVREVMAAAMSEGDHALALQASARLEKQSELVARLAGQLVERRIVEERRVVLAAEWVELRSRLLGALRPFPEAWAAVRLAITEGGGDELGR